MKYLNIKYKALICAILITSSIEVVSYQTDSNIIDDVQSVHSHIFNLNIRAFAQDSLGNMWIATFHGLNRYNGYEFVQYFYDMNDTLSLSDDLVLSLFLDSSHNLWIGTATCVNRYDFETNSFHKYPATTGDASYIFAFYEDHNHKIWVGTNSGPGWIDPVQHKIIMEDSENRAVNLFMEDDLQRLWMGLNGSMGLAYKNEISWRYLTVPGNRSVTSLYCDPQGIWWLGTDAGLVLFDPINQTFKEPPEPCRQNSLLNNTQINFIKEINPLIIIIGTQSQGIFKYDILTQTLLHNEPHQLCILGSNQLLSCYIDRQDNVWIGSFDRGFSVWKRYMDFFDPDPVLSNAFKNKFVTRILEDKFGNLWISTRYHGLFHYSASGKLTQYNAQNSKLFKDHNYLIESVFIDSQNILWIGLSEELLKCRFTGDGQLSIIERKDIKGVGAMAEDKNGRLWVGAISGLYRLTTDRQHIELKPVYMGNVPEVCTLSSGDLLFSSYGSGIFRIAADNEQVEKFIVPESIANRCITIFEDSRGQLWFGSYGNGLLFLATDRFQILTRNNGLPSNDVLCFREDRQGDVWISTSYGISRFRTADNKIVNYFSGDGILGNQFHEKAGLRHSDGRIFFTGNHGLSFFNPAAVLPNKFPPQIHFTDLKIMNRSVKPADKGSVLTKSIAFTNHITLNHKNTVVSFDYSGIDFLAPEKLRYVYKLEGFDKDWNYVGNFRRATYSNLSRGEYRFVVKAINDDGIESPHPAILHITVKPAPWFSWQAIIMYLSVLIAGIFWLFRLLFRMKLNKQLLEMEHCERQREKQTAEMKMSFFTNISHELRTPLTLISAPLEQLLKQTTLDAYNTKLLTTISRNVQRLLRLTNQLLDFRKMESGIQPLKVTYTDIMTCINSVKELFIYKAVEKQMNLTFEPHVAQLQMWIDTDKLEKILHNLLSNALKYTPQKGCVEIFTQEINGFIEITVSDTGPGIPDDKFDDLFVQFSQITSSPDYCSSGIGLYFTKRLVEAHGGTISAKNQLGGGMAFSFVLPLNDIYANDEKEIKNNVLHTRKNVENNENIPSATPDESTEQRQYNILVVEDNAELIIFIRTMLKDNYHVTCASNGAEAFETAQNETPDLIISDVVMPGISGYQLCELLKQHPALSHVPVILLTAKSSIDAQIEGLEHGADLYICKPFHVDYLLLSIANLLKNRETLREYFSTPQRQSQTTVPIKLNEIDQIFLNKMTELLEAELDNSELNIISVARNLGFSRSGFYRKIKGLTDLTPLDFLRNYRLKRAAEMILEGKISLNEVAEKTGFGTYSYFSLTFKKQFGINPKDYRKKLS